MKLTLIFVLALACLAGGELTGPMSQEQNPAIREAKPEEIPFAYDAAVFATAEIEQVRKTVFEQDNVPANTPAHACFHLRDKRPLPALDRGSRSIVFVKNHLRLR